MGVLKGLGLTRPTDSQVGTSDSLVLSSWLLPHMALGGLSDAKRPRGSGGAVGSQKLSLWAMRAITSCLSCSSEPIKGFVSVAADLGEGQRGGSVREKFFKALSDSGIGPFDLSVPLVLDP